MNLLSFSFSVRKVEAKKIPIAITSKFSGPWIFLVNSSLFLLSLKKLENFFEKRFIKYFLKIKKTRNIISE